MLIKKFKSNVTFIAIFVVFQSNNPLGSCGYSPDVLKQGIECVSCLACAKCLLYHCHYDDENFTGKYRKFLFSSLLEYFENVIIS